MTSFAVEKCSESDTVKNVHQTVHLTVSDQLFIRTAGLPLYFFGITGDKESQRSFLHLDVVARVDKDAGLSEK